MATKLHAKRSSRPVPGTHWRPLSHFEYGSERINFDQLFNEIIGKEYTPIHVDDPYNKRATVGKFVISRTKLVICDSRNTDTIEQTSNIRPGTLVSNFVQIDPSALIGNFVELQPRVTVEEESEVGDRSVLLKGTRINAGSKIGSMGFLAQEVSVGDNVTTDLGCLIERDSKIEHDTSVGLQTTIKRGTCIGPRNLIGERARIGEYCRIYHDVTIGDKAEIGNFTIIGNSAIIGEKAIVGRMSQLMPTAWIRAYEVIGDVNSSRFMPRRNKWLD